MLKQMEQQVTFKSSTLTREAQSNAHPTATVSPFDESLSFVQSRVRRAIGREELNSWVAMRPARVYRDLFFNWGGIAVALLLASVVARWWMYAIAFVVIGGCQYGLFILAHDALHKTLHPNRAVNDWLARWLIYAPMFMGLEDARRTHLEHHQTLGTQADPDRYLHILSNKGTPLKFLLFCSGLATFGKTVLKVTPFGRLLNGSKQAAKQNQATTSKTETLLAYARQRVPVAVAQVLFLAFFLFSPLPLWAYLLLWVAPIYFLVFLPDEIRAFCDHAVLSVADDEVDNQRLVTFRPSRLEAKVLAPHNMHYHAEHHLWPGIPYYNLPKAHQFTKDRVEVTVKGSYLPFLRDVIRTLSAQAADKRS